MAIPRTKAGPDLTPIAEAEHLARIQFLAAEQSGAEAAIIDELYSNWRSVLTTLLRAYSTPGNWKGRRPRAFIPQDVATLLAGEIDSRIAAEAEFKSALRVAHLTFEQDRVRGGSGRIGMCAAINATLTFMQTTRPGDSSLLHLPLLATILAGLEQGCEPDRLVVPPKKNGDRRASLMQSLLQQYAAAAVSVLMDDPKFQPGEGQRRTEAAKRYVQRKLDQLGLKKSWRTVGNWHSKVVAELPAGIGRSGKPDKMHPDGTLAPCGVQAYLSVWCPWRTKAKPKGEEASIFVNRFLGDKLKNRLRILVPENFSNPLY
jgi:hypothetical protein